MRIEKLELIGFKSFAEKTTFHLHPGITCIVGPNGSGKSNIVDSFRWVLGEQSAKSLRGEKMEEVIFNGSATKKPRGMSEVDLFLSFESPEQGNGGSESLTLVGRRLYRSGESEYLINKNQCRLRDIKDLFLDTGLEIKSYSILEQGRIGEILNAKPQDRRFLIEEVAGVMKYKVRRAEALSKLESSRLNLQRVNDIVTEVKRQINSLDRQVKKAERYKKLSSELRSIELKLAKRDYMTLTESLNRILAEYTSLKEQEALVRGQLNRTENTIETKRIGLLEKEKALDALMADLQAVEREVAETERTIAVSTKESSNLSEYLVKVNQQESEVMQRLEGLEDRKRELDAIEMDLNAAVGRLRQELSEKNEVVRSMEQDLSEREELIETKRKEIFRIAEESSHLRNEIGKISTSMESLDKRHASLLREQEEAREHLRAIDATREGTDGTIVGKNNELLAFLDRKERLNHDIDGHKADLEDLRNRHAKTREELASVSSRLTSLQEIMHEDLSREALSDHVRILASIAEVLEVEEVYERAIENVLSEKINGFIIQSRGEIAAAAPLMRERGIRRTAFVPLDVVTGGAEQPSGIPDSPHGDTILGRAADLVRIQKDRETFAPAIRNLLQDVLVVRDLASAFSLPGNAAYTYITLDGERVEPNGVVTVGEGRGILKRKREIRELETLIEHQRSDIERFGDAITKTENSFQDKKASLKDVEASVVTVEKEISLLRLTAENQDEERERISRKLSYLILEGEEVVKEKGYLEKVLTEKEAETEAVQSRKSEEEQLLSNMREAVLKDKERLEADRASITELRLSLNSLRERLESVAKEAEASSALHTDLLRTRDMLTKEKADTDARIEQCTKEVALQNDRLKEFVLRADTLRGVISGDKEIIRTESEELISLEQEARAFRGRLDSFTTVIGETDVSMAEHKLKIENLSETIKQNHGIEIHSFDAEPVLSEDEDRLNEIRTKIQELGPVNLGTLDEYEELKNRYEFLVQQQDDLNRSIAELEEAITKINSTTRKKLRDAFEELNEKFSEVFALLFGGGKAGLVMTDENNILESGIDIIAQPPGKKLQNILLLSGGEKALTALSLLFASFLIKPSPLCILDEVDAALDDSNIDRFARMLRELSSKIQFIVVTHNRITMEAADHLYGITMEEPGVSKVISMQLADAVTTT